MNAPPAISRRLHLESLETRTLLAADAADPFGLTADFNLALHALNGTGDYQASFSTNFGNHQLVITGSASSALIIDLAQLPSFITNLKISSFASVSMTGTDHVDNLILTGIGSVAADGLSVEDSVLAKDVGSLSLAYVGKHALVTGSEMSLSVDSFDEFGDILSAVDTLTFTTQAKWAAIYALGTNKVQTLNLTYTPKEGALGLSGYENSSVHIVMPPVDSGGSTPETPSTDTGGTSGGGTEPGSTSNEPGPLVVVTVPLDDQTRAFLDQIRRLLHSSDFGADQQVLDLLNRSDHATRGINLLGAEKLAAWTNGSVSVTRPFNDVTGDPGVAIPPQAATSKFIQSGQEQMIWSDPGAFLGKSEAPAPTDLPDSLSLPNLLHVDVSWPIVLSATDVTAFGPNRPSDNDELSLGDRVQALGSYIVERVTAEFSPGQQSLVLLIDPQPSRSSAGARRPEIERNSVPAMNVVASVLYV